MRTWRKASAIAGLSALSVSIALPYLLRLSSTAQIESAHTRVEIAGGFGMPTACPWCWASDELTVEYPSTIRVDQSATVETTGSGLANHGVRSCATTFPGYTGRHGKTSTNLDWRAACIT